MSDYGLQQQFSPADRYFSSFSLQHFKKICTFAMLSYMPEAPMGKGLGKNIYIKGVTVRFGFDSVRTSQIQTKCQKQSNGNVPWEVYYIYRCCQVQSLGSMCYLYNPSVWGFRRCSFRHFGQCEGLYRVERVTGWLHAFLSML